MQAFMMNEAGVISVCDLNEAELAEWQAITGDYTAGAVLAEINAVTIEELACDATDCPWDMVSMEAEILASEPEWDAVRTGEMGNW